MTDVPQIPWTVNKKLAFGYRTDVVIAVYDTENTAVEALKALMHDLRTKGAIVETSELPREEGKQHTYHVTIHNAVSGRQEWIYWAQPRMSSERNPAVQPFSDAAAEVIKELENRSGMVGSQPQVVDEPET